MFKFNLGDRAKDSMTSFEGIIIARTEFLNGCTRYGLKPTFLQKAGSTLEEEYFDEAQIEIVEAKNQTTKKEKPPGGPGPITPRCGNK